MAEDRKKIEGRASTLGTKRLADRFKMDGSYNRVSGFSWSTLGLGTYLGGLDGDTDRAVEMAVESALDRGINVFDTAINYRGQKAERSLGRALTSLIESPKERAEILVCTKGGIVPFDAEKEMDATTYIRETYVNPDVIDASDIVAGGFCYTPDFIEFSLNQSLENLNVETVDIFYLHNIEFAKPHVGDGFDDLLRRAFERLEKLVVDRKIAYYGLATWVALRSAANHPGHLELEEVIGLAKDVAGPGHHCRFMMAPFSLMMLEAMEVPSQTVGGEKMPLVDAVQKLAVGLVGSSPLAGGNLVDRWPGVSDDQDVVRGMSPVQQALQFARSVPGFASILTGMKQPQHVEQNLLLFKETRPWEPEEMVAFIEAAQD